MPSRCPAATAREIGCAEPTGTRRATAMRSSTLGADEIWKGTFTPAGRPVRLQGRDQPVVGRELRRQAATATARTSATTATAGTVAFYYDHRTHWVTNNVLDDIVVATGAFQSEMGCPADGDVDCMRAGCRTRTATSVYSLSTTQVPAGAYDVRWRRTVCSKGRPQSFTVEGRRRHDVHLRPGDAVADGRHGAAGRLSRGHPAGWRPGTRPRGCRQTVRGRAG